MFSNTFSPLLCKSPLNILYIFHTFNLSKIQKSCSRNITLTNNCPRGCCEKDKQTIKDTIDDNRSINRILIADNDNRLTELLAIRINHNHSAIAQTLEKHRQPISFIIGSRIESVKLARKLYAVRSQAEANQRAHRFA